MIRSSRRCRGAGKPDIDGGMGAAIVDYGAEAFPTMLLVEFPVKRYDDPQNKCEAMAFHQKSPDHNVGRLHQFSLPESVNTMKEHSSNARLSIRVSHGCGTHVVRLARVLS